MKHPIRGLALATLLVAQSHVVLADGYPDETIDMIVGYSAGGGTDVMARTVATYLEKHLGGDASVVVRNAPGAGGQIGFTQVATARPDGYTIGTMNLPTALALTYDRAAAYDIDSFIWLANFVSDPSTLVVPLDGAIQSVEDLIAAAKEPGAVTVGLASLGGNDHFAAIQFANAAGVELTQVPFKGAANARTALMGGHVAMGTMAYSQTVGFEESLRVLAILSEERLPYAPDIPTARELGLDIMMGSLRGIVAPAGLPEEAAQALADALAKTAADPEFLARMAEQGSPVQFTAGADYRAVAEAQNEAAARIWEETPWK